MARWEDRIQQVDHFRRRGLAACIGVRDEQACHREVPHGELQQGAVPATDIENPASRRDEVCDDVEVDAGARAPGDGLARRSAGPGAAGVDVQIKLD